MIRFPWYCGRQSVCLENGRTEVLGEGKRSGSLLRPSLMLLSLAIEQRVMMNRSSIKSEGRPWGIYDMIAPL